MVENDTGLRLRIIDVIKEIEHHSMVFSKDDVVEHAKHEGISEEDVDEIFQDLFEEGYIYHVVGTENLYSRSIWKDYSHAQEDSSIGI